MDTLRKLERREHDELKGMKYSFLKKNSNLTDQQAQRVSQSIRLYPHLGEGYRLKE